MSATWQQYVDTQLVSTGSVDQAIIIGKSDGAVWANTPEFLPRLYEGVVTQDDGTEAKQVINEAVILTKVGNTLRKDAAGIRINGVKYMVTRTYADGSDDSGAATIYLKKPRGGACLVVTNQAIVIGTFDEGQGQSAATCNFAVESLGKYLFQNGY